MNQQILQEIVLRLMVNPKGLLAADESQTSSDKRFAARGLAVNEEIRRGWRDLLLAAPGIEAYVSGVILHDETIHQNALNEQPFPELLRERGMDAGIKVDLGLVDNPETPGETITKGIDDLDERLSAYERYNPTFAKWRATFTIDGDMLPTNADIIADTKLLAEYAKICQEHGIVPIVEPEVIYEGTHTIERAREVTTAVIENLFLECANQGIFLPGLILKTGMVLAGSKLSTQSTPSEVAEATLGVLEAVVPSEVGGIVFLSGGQGPLQATENLQAIGAMGRKKWPITYSYSRAVQDPAMDLWMGKPENLEAARAIFLHRLKMNSLAREGKYSLELESTTQ